jgi:hypothetical protein
MTITQKEVGGYLIVSGCLFFAIMSFRCVLLIPFFLSVLLHTARDGVRYILLLVCTCMHSFVFGGFHCSEYGFWLSKGASFCVFAWLEGGEIAIGGVFLRMAFTHVRTMYLILLRELVRGMEVLQGLWVISVCGVLSIVGVLGVQPYVLRWETCRLLRLSCHL